MGPEDTKVWSRFIAKFGEMYSSVEYDTKIGTPPPFVSSGEMSVGGDIADLYKRKIDVVGFRGNDIDIIEVKPTAGFSAIGQIRGYMMLWRKEHPTSLITHPVIICEAMAQDVRTMAEIDGIEVFIV